MSKLRVRYQTIEIGSHDIHVVTLRDRNEFEDDDGEAARVGVSEGQWALFGLVWDASRVLAERMAERDVDGLRVLEVGSGIGLASLVLNRRGADITATDRHPRAAGFMERNAALNDDTPIPFERTGWADLDDDLGQFDLIIGSDLLYEPASVQLLSEFIARHANATCRVVLVDPGRGYMGKLGRALEAFGFEPLRSELVTTEADDGVKKMRVVEFGR